MIDKIYIPTCGRSDRQITWNNLPQKWKDKTVLVVDSTEVNKYDKPILSIPEGMKGIASIREWIVKQTQEEKICMFDDDLDLVYTRKTDESGPTNKKLNDDEVDEMMNLMSEWLDDHVFCGLDATWSHPQFDIDYKFCGRVCSNVFYNIKTLPMNEINWTDLEISEDYNIALQLLTRGFSNKVSTRYRVSPVGNFSAGGCSSYRTIELHNESFIKLQEKFPKFITLKEKVQNSGLWKGQKRLAGVIQWKKAYESSQKSSLSNFFE